MRKMKDSGVEWIGEIPEDWIITKYKYFSKNGMGLTILKTEVSSNGVPIYSATQSNEIFGYISNPGLLLKYGDLVIPARGNSIGFVTFVVDEEATCTQTTIYSMLHDICKKYAYYCCYGLQKYWFNYDDTAIPQITVGQIENNILPFPPIDIQHLIADYLDDKCGKIDRYIEKQQKIIDKLKEYKQAVITEAVTKGLNPDVPMKDSGIEWIGMIPEHWDVKKLKYATDILRGKFNHRPRNDPDYYDGQYPFIQTGDVARATKYINDFSQTLNQKGYDVSKEFPSGSVVMTIAANVADVSILNFRACFPDSIVGFIPKDVDKLYLFYILKAMRQQLLKNAIISTQLNLNIEIIKEEFIAIPSKREQNEIILYLENTCDEINSAIAKQTRIIEKLTEYKKSLIYEAVTGKMEV